MALHCGGPAPRTIRCSRSGWPGASAIYAAGRSGGRAASTIHRAAAVAAVGADVPLEFQQMIAARAGPTQLCATGRANLVIVLDTIVAGRAGLALGHFGQQ